METENRLGSRASRTAERVAPRPVIAPRVDIFENQDEILVRADMPGVDSGSLSIRVDKGELHLQGRRQAPAPGELLTGGLRDGDFERSFLLPTELDSDKISADLKAGVLTLRLPKSERVKPRTIKVRAS